MPEGKNVEYSATEIMTIEAARRLKNGTVCFVGIGMPSAAANLARLTHAPEVVLIYESGTIGAKPDVLPLSIGDGELAEHADTVVSIPEIFRYWLQGGRVDVGFLGAAQVDRFGNINTTVIGSDYAHPKVRLPGAGGAPEIASNAKQTWIIIKQSKRTFVPKLDFITSVGHLDRRRLAQEVRRARRGSHRGDHGPGRAHPASGHARAHAHGAAPRHHHRAGEGRDGLGPQGRRAAGAHRRAHGSRARRPCATCRREPRRHTARSPTNKKNRGPRPPSMSARKGDRSKK